MEQNDKSNIKQRIYDLFEELGFTPDLTINKFQLLRAIDYFQIKTRGIIKQIFGKKQFFCRLMRRCDYDLTIRKIVENIMKQPAFMKQKAEQPIIKTETKEQSFLDPKETQGYIFIQCFLKKSKLSTEAIEILRINGIISFSKLKALKKEELALLNLKTKDLYIIFKM